MSKRVKESVHELIKSLTKSEKRYFKLMSSRHTIGDENNYVILFDAIEKQIEYDEQALFQQFKGAAFLNKFAITKRRLYDHILNSLDLFHNNSSQEAQIYKMLHSADILYEKSLYEQAKSILRSAEKLANKKEYFNLLLIIRSKQKRLFENTSYTELSKIEIDQIYATDLYIHNQSLLYNKLWNIKSQLFHLLAQKGNSRSLDEFSDFKLIIDELAKNVKQNEWCFETHYLFHHIYSAYYFAINDFEKCLESLQKNIIYFEDHPAYINGQPNKYFSILTNTIFVCEKLGKIKQAQIIFQKLKNLPQQLTEHTNEDLKIKLFSSISSIEIDNLIQHGDFKEALFLIPKINEGLDFYDDKIATPRKIYLSYKIAVVYLALGDFPNSLKWINNILNDKLLDQKEDILAYTHLLSVIVHIEMKHFDLLAYLVKSILRSLKAKNRLYEPEKAFLNFVSKLIKTSDVFEKEQFWENTYNVLVELYKDMNNAVSLDYFDILSWSEAKFKRQSFQEIIKLKFNRKLLQIYE